MTLYTLTQAAQALDIHHSTLQERMRVLEEKGEGLSAKAGELVYQARHRKITEQGLRRLAQFREPKKMDVSEVVLIEVKRRARRHLKLFAKEEIDWKCLIAEVQADLEKYPTLLADNWEAPPAYVPHQCYHAYTAPREG